MACLPRPSAATARLVVAGVLAALAGTGVSVAAGGTVILGHDEAPTGGSSGSLTLPRMQVSSDDPTDVLVVPRAGTITSWTVWVTARPSSPTWRGISLLVMRETSPGTFTVVAISDRVQAGVGESTNPTSLPVQAGDRIAIAPETASVAWSSGGTYATLGGFLRNPGESASISNTQSGTLHFSAVLQTPEATASPRVLDFGEVATRDVSPPRSVTVTNAGDADLHVTRLRVRQTGSTLFDISADTCTGAAVAPGGTCTFDVAFAPLAPGSWAPGIEVQSEAPTVNVRLRGTGVAPIEATPAAHDFGTVARGATSAPQAFTVRNRSDDPATVGALVKQGTGRSLFAVDPGTCTGTLAPGATCTLSVTFAPLTAGTWSPEVVVQTDRGAARLALSGTGT